MEVVNSLPGPTIMNHPFPLSIRHCLARPPVTLLPGRRRLVVVLVRHRVEHGSETAAEEETSCHGAVRTRPQRIKHHVVWAPQETLSTSILSTAHRALARRLDLGSRLERIIRP